MRALLLGFGSVGRAVADILVRREDYPGLAGLDVKVVGIVTGTHGARIDARGLDLARVLADWSRVGRLGAPSDDAVSALEAIRTVPCDVVVELTPLTRKARGKPAIAHVARPFAAAAMSSPRTRDRWPGPSPTCRGGPRSGAGNSSTRRGHGRRPRLRPRAARPAGGDGDAREGILNSTTNAILCALERGETFAQALARAQREGYAKRTLRRPRRMDGAVKLSALARVLMGVSLPPEAVVREGITGLDPAQVAAARARGGRLKLVCEAWREGRGAKGRVALREIPLTDPFALVDDTSSILRLVTDLAGAVVITEERPDIHVTAYGVISDLLTLSSAIPARSPRARTARGAGSRSRPRGRAG